MLALGVLFLFLWQFFWMVYPAIFIALIAVLVAIVLHAPAKYLARWMPYRLSFALTVVGFLASLGGLMVAIVPQIAEQISQLTAELPRALDAAGDWFAERTDIARDPQVVETVNQQLGDFIGRFVPIAVNIITTAIGSFAIIIMAIFLAYQPSVYRDLVIRMAPVSE